MIAKEKDMPLYIEKLQALERRLPTNHPKYQHIVDAYSRSMAGFKGEKSLDYYLSFLPKDKYTVLHDLRLFNGEYYFQIDILLLTEKFILIIEVKNYAGVIQYDPYFNQLIRTMNGKEEVLPNPLSQIERHKFQLLTLLNKRNFPYIPVETLAVISNPLTLLKTTGNQVNVAQKLIHSNNLSKRLKEIDQIHRDPKTSVKELRSLSKHLIKMNQPVETDILGKFDISQQELLTGVMCPSCGTLPMKRLHGKWKCLQCMHLSKEAHLRALKDFFLLIGETISNKEVRNFLNIESEATAKRLLSSLKLSVTGTTKDRIYYLEK